MFSNHCLAACAAATTNGISMSDWFAAVVSICTLLLNILFYIVIAPRINFKFQKKEDFLKYSSEFLSYLSELNSFTSFDGVPSRVKSYCVTIKLLFKSGSAPKELDECMEAVYQLVKKRKSLNDDKAIGQWEEKFRNKTHELRVHLAKYTGVF